MRLGALRRHPECLPGAVEDGSSAARRARVRRQSAGVEPAAGLDDGSEARAAVFPRRRVTHRRRGASCRTHRRTRRCAIYGRRRCRCAACSLLAVRRSCCGCTCSVPWGASPCHCWHRACRVRGWFSRPCRWFSRPCRWRCCRRTPSSTAGHAGAAAASDASTGRAAETCGAAAARSSCCARTRRRPWSRCRCGGQVAGPDARACCAHPEQLRVPGEQCVAARRAPQHRPAALLGVPHRGGGAAAAVGRVGAHQGAVVPGDAASLGAVPPDAASRLRARAESQAAECAVGRQRSTAARHWCFR